ncbi:hypothetical protein FJV46_08295 [Arthrobacter agilis]|uniref:hypothetical protein n=1 Tax=Arthrobacter agilis TaxID=37921 RepID=UPI000B54C256|nr:hypothetical protein [Arthrobacter agilis]OUM43130.1 hypothetical protein B8W74_07820 [Arthrobacter agilis]PPB46074.1 hypothetical protein CI784_10020 [Arthrobacter agilis]TPV25616.1 hypothetical protein FJV46_08295 [Arthrobacter agilis]VDR33387.1 Uncharacterised protein [Arthrobacter agilis]
MGVGTDDAMAVVVEIAGSTLVALGLGLLIAALVIRLIYGAWTRSQAIAFQHEGHAYLRWHDHRYRIIEALWSSGRRRATTSPIPAPRRPGEEVTIYYHAREPTQWTLEKPYRGTRLLAVVGLGLAALGTLVGFLPG